MSIMDPLALFFIWLLATGRKFVGPKPPTPSAPPSVPSAAEAEAKARQAQAEADAAKAKAKQASAAQKAPPPWPTFLPPGLPAFPGGWEPDEPPSSAVVARAWQLLPVLWTHGAGTRTTEFVGGKWVTFVAAMHGMKKGVTAFRVRPGAAKAA